jgi:quercetin dioxygenase-like cupin family protein
MGTLPSVALAFTLTLYVLPSVTTKNGHAASQAQPPSAEFVRGSALVWEPSELAGIELAVVSGDPARAGEIFVLRARMQDGAKFPVHTHPGAENVTVLQGTLLVGVGDRFQVDRAQTLSPGDFGRIPGGLRHFAQARGEVVIEVSGLGPFAIQYVDPDYRPAKALKEPR